LQVISIPSSSQPEDDLPLTPLINHSSTFKANTPSLPSSKSCTFSLNPSLDGIALTSSNAKYGLQPILVDRWTNSQSPLIDHGLRDNTDYPLSLQLRAFDFPRDILSTGHRALNLHGTPPPFEPDSADTTFSTLGPETPFQTTFDFSATQRATPGISFLTGAFGSSAPGQIERRRSKADTNDEYIGGGAVSANTKPEPASGARRRTHRKNTSLRAAKEGGASRRSDPTSHGEHQSLGGFAFAPQPYEQAKTGVVQDPVAMQLGPGGNCPSLQLVEQQTYSGLSADDEPVGLDQ
jgi:hypothetical protein